MKRYLAILAGLSCLCTTAFANDPGVTDNEVKIGGFTAESGKFAVYASIGRAASAYFDRVNAKGGVNGRKINYIRIDTQGEHVKSVQAVRKLVEEDQIFAFFLNVGATHKAAYKYILENNVPDMYFTDALVEYAKPMNKYLFPGTGGPQIFSEGKTMALDAAKKYKGKRVCFVATDDQLGEEFINGGKEGIEEANAKLSGADKLKVGATERAERSLPQVNSQILNLKKDGCEVVLDGLFANLGPSGMNYAATQGFKPAWYILSFNVGPKFLSLLPEGYRDNIVSSTTLAVDETFKTPGWKDFVSLMQKNDIPLQRAQVGYAAAELMTEVLKKAGKNLTRESLITAAESMNGYKCSICLAPNQVSATNHLPFLSPTLIVSKHGKWVKM
jgi:branched-chain amino acid transport system substrate-binding protein